MATIDPSTWIAGQTYPITIMGTGYTTPANAPSNCFATQIAVGVNAGSLTLSDVTVVDSTKITATVAPADADPDETATINMYGGPMNGSDDVVRAPGNARVMTSNAAPVANANNTTPAPSNAPLVATATAQVNSPCSIKQPKDNSSFPLSANNTTETDSITFQADSSTTVSWQALASYTTSGGRGPYGATKNFSSSKNSSVSEQFASMGGQTNVKATCGAKSDSITSTITGASISRSAIINQLVSIYGSGKPTPRLMTGIAWKESTIQQFTSNSLYGVSALWPYESYDGGSHIGLMMVPTTMKDAFDWTINAQDGVNLFKQKVAMAITNEMRIQAAHTGLRNLTAFELENMAILLYSQYAPPKNNDPLDAQYYAPSCSGTVNGNICSGGSWDWVINYAGVLGDKYGDGTTYVEDIRNHIQ